jgi:demethylmenaquinone methyltransferase/2-methoxy-6-polyprenyl-1,4-benzoquinol methylase
MEQYPTTQHGRQAKARANRAMFDAIARRYDSLNGLMSLGLDRGWRRRLVNLCALAPGDRCLDLCCGTGAVTRELARLGAWTVGVDASAEMLAIAHGVPAVGVQFVQGDALQLPFPPAAFDVVTIAFGNRNVANLAALFAEMARVCKPGGRIVSLEISPPPAPLWRGLFFAYFTRGPIWLARLLGADPSAYRYLAESVRAYPNPHAVAALMTEAGLTAVEVHCALGGALAWHRGVKGSAECGVRPAE